jgi:hypothetical protein
VLGMDFEVWVVALVGEERRHISSSTGCIVVGEFSNWEEWCPVALLIVAVDPEVLFQSLISVFDLTIALGMVKFNFISRALPKDHQKCDTNSETLSDVTCEGTPCLEKT